MNEHALRKVAISIVMMIGLGACAATETANRIDGPTQPEAAIPAARLVETAKGLLEREQHRNAAQLFVQALDQQPDNAEAKLGLAETYLATGAVRQAQAAFDELAAGGPATVEIAAKQGLGISLLLIGQADKAQDVLLRVVDADPSAWRAWNALGRCHDLKERWTEAEQAYAMALKAKPDAYAVHNNAGMSLLAQARHGEAEGRFLDALALRPDFDLARNNLRFALALQGRYRDAFAGAGRQELPAVLNNVGYAAMLRGDSDRAKAYFARAMEASPHFLEIAHENLQRAKGPGERTD
jgi:Tfp pilus assembly protein PilF